MLYIHEYPDWTDFRYDAVSVLAKLGRVRFLEGRLLGSVQSLNRANAETDLLARDICANFAIDDRRLKYEKIRGEVALALESKSSDNMVRNLLGATQNAKAPLTEDRLFAWHASLGSNKVRSYRKSDAKVSFEYAGETAHSYRGVPEYRLAAEVSKFIDWYNADGGTDILLKAAVAHFRFLAIRPFDDANGRIARALSEMLLVKNEGSPRRVYSLCESLLDKRAEYFQILAKTQAMNGDITEWILWFLGAFESALEKGEAEVAHDLRAASFRARHSDASLTDRQQKLLAALLGGSFTDKLTTSHLASLAGTSPDTALRDIQDLIDKGILKKESRGGRSTSYRLAD